MAMNEASRLWRDVCRLQQQSAASGVGGQQHTVRQLTARQQRVARRAERWPKWPWERFLRWEGLAYQPQATAFPFVAAEGETNKRLPWPVGQLLTTAFPFVAAEIGMERWLPWLASQLLATAFSFAAAAFEVDKRLPRQVSQLLATAFPFAAATLRRTSGSHGGQANF